MTKQENIDARKLIINLLIDEYNKHRTQIEEYKKLNLSKEEFDLLCIEPKSQMNTINNACKLIHRLPL